ncbi:MAG: Adenosylmethionine-8-amino-7-oxononanoate aminotransferase, partial [uncultured Gemmatimonadetes bacterium]
ANSQVRLPGGRGAGTPGRPRLRRPRPAGQPGRRPASARASRRPSLLHLRLGAVAAASVRQVGGDQPVPAPVRKDADRPVQPAGRAPAHRGHGRPPGQRGAGPLRGRPRRGDAAGRGHRLGTAGGGPGSPAGAARHPAPQAERDRHRARRGKPAGGLLRPGRGRRGAGLRTGLSPRAQAGGRPGRGRLGGVRLVRRAAGGAGRLCRAPRACRRGAAHARRPVPPPARASARCGGAVRAQQQPRRARPDGALYGGVEPFWAHLRPDRRAGRGRAAEGGDEDVLCAGDRRHRGQRRRGALRAARAGGQLGAPDARRRLRALSRAGGLPGPRVRRRARPRAGRLPGSGPRRRDAGGHRLRHAGRPCRRRGAAARGAGSLRL